MSTIGQALLTIGRVLYDNAARQNLGSVSYGGVETQGFGPLNLFDWQDFTTFKPSNGVTQVTVTLTENVTVDSLGLYIKVPDADFGQVTLRYNAGGGDILLHVSPLFTPGTEFPVYLADFTPVNLVAGNTLIFEFNTTNNSNFLVRQAAAGPILDFAMGQQSAIKPSELSYGQVLTNAISVNGSIIGRSVRRLEKKQEIMLDNLEFSWVKDNWNSLAKHATRFPFFYQYNSADHPDSVSFSAAVSISAPSLMARRDLMTVSMPLHSLTD